MLLVLEERTNKKRIQITFKAFIINSAREMTFNHARYMCRYDVVLSWLPWVIPGWLMASLVQS
jgi:hypothetical protein